MTSETSAPNAGPLSVGGGSSAPTVGRCGWILRCSRGANGRCKVSDEHICYLCLDCDKRLRQELFESPAYKALIDESTRLRARATEYHATKAILRDLIDELKADVLERPDGTTEHCVHPCVYRAEQRLREAQGE